MDLSGNLPSYTLVTPTKAPTGGRNGNDQNDGGIVGKSVSVAVKLEPKNDQSSKKDANTENKMWFMFFSSKMSHTIWLIAYEWAIWLIAGESLNDESPFCCDTFITESK